MSDERPTSIWKRLQERPALLVGVGAGIVALVIVLVVVLAGGGGDSEDVVSGDTSGSATPTATASATATPTPTPAAPLPKVTDVAPELDFFGELAAVHSQPVTATFDSAADSLSLADGAAIEVPSGAFPAATELSVVIIDLLFENYLINPPEARIYVLSTEDDIVLGVPLVLEVPKPAASVNVTRFVDGEWLPVDVPAGVTTRIEITHFSDNTIEVGDKPSGEPELATHVDVPGGISLGGTGGGFILKCTSAVLSYFKISDSVAVQVAVSACSQALAESGFLDQGNEISLDCVLGQMEDLGRTFEQATFDCTLALGQADGPESQPEPTPTPQPQAEPEPEPTASGITGTLAPGITSSSLTVDQCIERPDFDAIFCDYTFNVTMDYMVSGLPANVSCTFPGQSSDFFALDSGKRLDLSSLDGLVSRAPMGVAVFDRSGNPKFSNPVSVECTLSTPFEGEEGAFRRLDDFKFTFDLPNVSQIDGCIPATSPDCSVQ